MEHKNWNGFKPGAWQNEINVRDFIQQNYRAYEGDSEFLSGPTARTESLMKKVQSLFTLERQYGGVLDIDTATVSSLMMTVRQGDITFADSSPAKSSRSLPIIISYVREALTVSFLILNYSFFSRLSVPLQAFRHAKGFSFFPCHRSRARLCTRKGNL